MDDPNIILLPSDQVIDGYKKLKEALLSAGEVEDAKDLTTYTMAASIEEASAAYPAFIKDAIAFVLLKQCPMDDARIITFGIRKQKMITLCEELKKISAGEDIDLEKILEDFI